MRVRGSGASARQGREGPWGDEEATSWSGDKTAAEGERYDGAETTLKKADRVVSGPHTQLTVYAHKRK